jgi:hypothetical protein
MNGCSEAAEETASSPQAADISGKGWTAKSAQDGTLPTVKPRFQWTPTRGRLGCKSSVRSEMRRREVVVGVASAVAWPDTLLAQKRTIPTIGFLNAGSRNSVALSAFLKGLQQQGYSEDRNVRIEYRWADGQFDRLPTMAAELVKREVAVIMAAPGSPAVSAAKASTSTIPIVFITGIDPVRLGFVMSLSRSEGNMTGVFNF